MNLSVADYVKIERLKLELSKLQTQRLEGGQLQNAIQANVQLSYWIAGLSFLLLFTSLGLGGLVVVFIATAFAIHGQRLHRSLRDDLDYLEREIATAEQRLQTALAQLDKLQAY